MRKPSPSRGLILLVLLAASTPTSSAEANAWTRERGSFYAELRYATVSAAGFYGPDFSRLDLGSRYTQHSAGLYVEVGVLDRWLTVVLDSTLYRRASLADQGYAEGLGDLRLGFWSGLLRSPFHLSAGLMIGVPTGDPRPSAPSPAAQLVANSLPTGDGELDVELAVAAGTSFGRWRFWPLEHYALARVGYWLRTSPRSVAFGSAEDFPDAINWQAELGTRLPSWPVVDRLWLVLRVYGTESFAGPESAAFSGLGGGVTHRSYSLGLRVRIWRGLAVAFSAAGAFSARNLPAGAYYTTSLSFER